MITESHNENVLTHVQIEIEDIQEEVDFWNSSVVCYVVGENPRMNVMKGFIRRTWRNLKVDKVSMVKKGVYLVRFQTMESRDKVLAGHNFFDSKPLILRPWSVHMNMEQEEIRVVPIWIQLKFKFKYLGGQIFV